MLRKKKFSFVTHTGMEKNSKKFEQYNKVSLVFVNINFINFYFINF